jgi:hypothetical protein
MLTVSTITLTPIQFTLYPLQQNTARHIHFTGAKYSCSSTYLLGTCKTSSFTYAARLHNSSQNACTHTYTYPQQVTLFHVATNSHTKKYLFLNTVNTTRKFPRVITQKWFIGSTKLTAPQISNRAPSPHNKFQYHVQWLQNIRQSEGKSLIKRKTKRILPYATQNQ